MLPRHSTHGSAGAEAPEHQGRTRTEQGGKAGSDAVKPDEGQLTSSRAILASPCLALPSARLALLGCMCHSPGPFATPELIEPSPLCISFSRPFVLAESRLSSARVARNGPLRHVELNFLIAHYLSTGPLRQAAEPLRAALQQSAAQLLPKRFDWEGAQHARTYEEMAQELPHVDGRELLHIAEAISTRNSAALHTAGGTILGRSHADSCTTQKQQQQQQRRGGSLSARLRCRSSSSNGNGGGTLSAHRASDTPRLPLSVLASYRKLVRCHGHKFPTYCVLFDRTGRRMITGSDDFLIKIWCTRTGYLIKTFKGHRSMVSDIALNTENTLLASASTDGSVRIWNLKTGEPRAVLMSNPHGRSKGITAVRFSPSPVPEIRFLAATDEAGLCRLYRWNRDSLTFNTTPITIDVRSETRDTISSFAFNHTGSRLAIATVKGYISIFSTIVGAAGALTDGNSNGSNSWGEPKLLARIAAHEASITTLVFSSDGEMFLTGSIDGTVKVWKCNSADLKWTSVSIDVKEPVPAPGDAPESALDDVDGVAAPRQPTAAVQAAVTAAAIAATTSAGLAANAIAALDTLAIPQPQPQSTTDTDVAASNLTPAPLAFSVPLAAGTPSASLPAPVSSGAPGDRGGGSDRAVGLFPETTREGPVETAVPLPPAQTIQQPENSGGAGGETEVAPLVPQQSARVETNQVTWSCDNTRIIASNNVGSVFAADPHTGSICWKKRAHSITEVYVLITHPTDPRVAISGGYDGRAIMWNVENGDILREFRVGELLFDGSFSEDGLKFALTSDTGAAMLFGLGPLWAYDDANKMHEQMFASDYTATIMDENHFVADQQSQIPSYLVPHSPLMDFDGRIYRRQKGIRFGLGIGMGVDEIKFKNEEAGRLAALDVELQHAYLDSRAAQAPIAEVRPLRGRGRRRRAEEPSARSATYTEMPEMEIPLMLAIEDDSDDEEYTAGEEEEEEEEEDDDEEDPEDEDANAVGGGASSRFGRGARGAGDNVDDSVVTVDQRGRRSALEMLRNRHNSADSRPQRGTSQRTASLRTTRRIVGGDDDDDDDDDDQNVAVDIDTLSNPSDNDMSVDSNGDVDIDSDQGNVARRPIRTSGRMRRARGRNFSADEDAFDVTVNQPMHPGTRTSREALDDDSEDNIYGGSQTRGGRRTRRTRAADERSTALLAPEEEEEEEEEYGDAATSDDDFRPNGPWNVRRTSAEGLRARRRGRHIPTDGDGLDEPLPQQQQQQQSRSRRVASESEHEDEDSTFERPAARVTRGLDSNANYSHTAQNRRPRRSTAQGRGAEEHGRLGNGASIYQPTASSLHGSTQGRSDDESDDFNVNTQRRGRNGLRSVRATGTTAAAADAPGSDDSPSSPTGPLTRNNSQPLRQSRRGQQQRATTTHGVSAGGTSTATRGASSSGGSVALINQEYKPTDWVLATSPSTVPYRPQIGDIIVYFKEGHVDFWDSPMRCQKLSAKLLPYVTMPNISVAVFGKVVGLRYAVGPPTFCTVKVQLLQAQSIEEMDMEANHDHELTRRFIQIQYHDCDGVPDFLILYSRYRASLRRSLKIGDAVEVLFDEDQAYQAVVTGFKDIKPTSRQTSVTKLIARNPWKSITVEWTHAEAGADSESKSEHVSPWELVHDDDAAEVEIPSETRATLMSVIDGLRDIADFGWFIKNVDYEVDYPDYLLNIAYPMCLDTVYERLDSGFYRHISAVTFDMGLIQENADTFNDPGTLVPVAAQKLMARYRLMLDQAVGGDANDDVESDGSVHDSALVAATTPGRRIRSTRLQQSNGSASQRMAGAAAAAAVAAVTIKSESPGRSRRGQSATSHLRKRGAPSPDIRQTRRSSRRRVEYDVSDGSDGAGFGGGSSDESKEEEEEYSSGGAAPSEDEEEEDDDDDDF